MFWNIPTHASSADAKGQMEVYDSNKNNYDDNDNYNDENDYRDGDDDAADKVPSPLPHEFLRWDMQHGEGITHTYHSPRPLYISISISKIVHMATVEKVTANWDISTKICAALLNGMEKSLSF